jgi:hypothetical protein
MKTAMALTLTLTGLSVSAAELRDTMRPPALPAAVAVRVPDPVTATVTAIFISESRRTAVVDGQLVRAGDRVGLCLVEAVLENGVRCRFPKEVRVLSLPRTDQVIKKPTAAAVESNGVP